MSNERINFYYDPTRQGYDTQLWKTVTGTPTVVSDVIRFNQAESVGYGDIFKGNIKMSVIVPVEPTTADVRSFGFKQIANNSYALFKIVDDVFSCECSFGGNTTNIVLTWNSDWTNTATDFEIVWTGFSAQFLINGVQVAFISDESIPHEAMSLSISNSNDDSMDLAYIEVTNVQNYI